jgi:hypothetical protein
MNPQVLTIETQGSSSVLAQPGAPTNFDNTASYSYDEDNSMVNDYQPDKEEPCPADLVHKNLVHCILPDKMANNLYTSWKALSSIWQEPMGTLLQKYVQPYLLVQALVVYIDNFL